MRCGKEPPSRRSPFLMSPTLPVMPGRSLGSRLAAPPVVVLGGGEPGLLPGGGIDPGQQLLPVRDVVALAHDHRAEIPVVVPVDVVVAGLQLRRVGDLRGDALRAAPAAEALLGCRVEDVDPRRLDERHGGRPHRLEHDLLRDHEVDRVGERRPERTELALLLVLGHDLVEPVDLRPGRVAEVLELHQPERLRGERRVLGHDPRVAQEGHPPLPLRVQELGPGHLLGPLLDHVGVVAHRVGVEVGRRADDVARLRLAADRLAVLADPADDLLVVLRPAREGGQPGRAVRVDEGRAERGVPVTERAAGRRRVQLAVREQLVERVPAADLPRVDRLQASPRARRAATGSCSRRTRRTCPAR